MFFITRYNLKIVISILKFTFYIINQVSISLVSFTDILNLIWHKEGFGTAKMPNFRA